MTKDAVLEKVKHLSAQVAMDEQPSVILSQGFAVCGQQSMSSIAGHIRHLGRLYRGTDTACSRQHGYRQGDQEREYRATHVHGPAKIADLVPGVK